ncbi:efflux RND transporter periplasmic adaptor subunit [Geobacter sp. DSM 9736]|uniref:efflux RND transporter periplasmic adaptor subunit n=1 Tax=Geobacter sp. DSM 9736 TaxID=1277350 RepID=UPI000B50C27B|nr:efflux RND transporter periplasmic adaptor subunit [Geobacter sp. DSM 9736]SNB46843.1 HlyD family secretion protein [Geobacter sp. DSM 9736]
MKKYIIPGLLLAAGIALTAYFTIDRKPEVTYRTAKIERGDVVSAVAATGSLAAVVTVQVGTQVSGTIQKLFVDFNSPVKKGQVIAQIDPSLFSAQVEQSRGNHLSAQANLQKAKADLNDAKRSLERNRQLLKEGIVSQGDFDTAENRYAMAAAAAKAAEASVAQTRGSLTQAETNLRYSTIRSPVNGTVVSRNIDIGQTVAASFQTPTLFTIAQDLTKMQIDTSVDEADISKVKVGQTVSFTVDAYPEVRFAGTVRQVRNAPIVAQNVVTYVVVIDVDNREMKLKPGMTANVSIETSRRDNVLKLPAAALRFKPKTKDDKVMKSGGEAKGRPGGAPAEKGKHRTAPDEQQVWVLDAEQKPRPVKVRTGISGDGNVELMEGSLKEGDAVIVEQISPQKKPSGGMGGGMGGGRSPMGMRM